ncbi:mycofactocin system transcriptional regulator [Streptomyces sp. NPDC049879]|uniref:mycofactocin system transcriptional regulator n=1 Tax=Streptomyces sp. NPDC049879 TaxID=3365598 RepID=UPI0037AC3E60
MTSSADVPQPAPRAGRQPATSVAEIGHVALQLFVRNGFAATTVDDIATACGIGRRTFFRYFPSKNDVPWGDFDALVERMREHLAATPPDVPLLDALRAAVIRFNEFPPEEVEYHRRRMELLLSVPTLVAHSTLRYAAWRQVIAEYAARRLGEPEDALRPQVIAWTFLAASLSAYEEWLRREDADLPDLFTSAFSVLDETFRGAGGGR